MHSRALVRWLFSLAASIAAAAIVDPILERLSNAGVFGPGNFTDHSNLDVLPAMSAAAALAIALVCVRVKRLLTPDSQPLPWLRRCALELTARSCPRLLPRIFALQIGVLFGMETLEQFAVAGHPLGGTIWLGAPIAISLIAHAIGCVAVTWGLYKFLNWSAKSIFHAVRLALEYVRSLLNPDLTPRIPLARCTHRKFIEPYLRSLQGRAPPSFLPAQIH